jgi:Domain of unknown function (DUF2760)
MEPWQIVVLTLVSVIVLKLLILLALAGGSVARLGLAVRLFYRMLPDAAFAGKAEALLAPPPPPKPVKRSGEALRLLTLLQREGRVLDFLLEDIASATDDQIGAGVRELHKKAQAVLKDHLTLAPVLPDQENEMVEVKKGFDPSAIRLTGNVTGEPPFKGRLVHRGWRVADFKLPAPPEGVDEFVVAPAEVELP